MSDKTSQNERYLCPGRCGFVKGPCGNRPGIRFVITFEPQLQKLMSKFVVQGRVKLRGEAVISGSKNAALPILAATLLASTPSTLHNVPDISDVHAFLKILSVLINSLSSVRLPSPPRRIFCTRWESTPKRHKRRSLLCRQLTSLPPKIKSLNFFLNRPIEIPLSVHLTYRHTLLTLY